MGGVTNLHHNPENCDMASTAKLTGKAYEDAVAGKCADVTPERWEEIKREFPHLPEIEDLKAPRNEYLVRLPAAVENWLVAKLTDPRDATMLSTMCNILVTTSVFATMLFFYPSHLLGLAIHVFNLLVWTERYILMLHYAEHRSLFRRGSLVRALGGNQLLPVVFAPFFGLPAGVYRAHHVVMHHLENNVFNEDLSSTEGYHRGRFSNFLMYWLKYFTSLYMLPVYAVGKGRYALAMQVGGGFVAWSSTMAVLTFWGHGTFVTWTFLVPFFTSSFALMFGNFSQHIFVHPDIATMPQKLKSYEFNCALTMQLINSFENQKTFNDGCVGEFDLFCAHARHSVCMLYLLSCICFRHTGMLHPTVFCCSVVLLFCCSSCGSPRRAS